MSAGRPTDYTPELLEKAEWYVSGGYKDCGDVVPTIAGLAIEINISRGTCHEWQNHDDKWRFSDIIDKLKKAQERELVNKGLTGDYNPQITKVMMARHGYSDKQEIDHTNSDGSMKQTHNVTIELVKPNGSNQSTDT